MTSFPDPTSVVSTTVGIAVMGQTSMTIGAPMIDGLPWARVWHD